ncbi:xanthine dehydrogenase YagT iron-sulfur-binding subunit [Sporobacter termitidis DSM 10068]|uniref:Xanthine dehydrogenase YagT iron-sulfur-binding subunit n=1 Tax=Sporobacter termitidis DSM 10068 TaxID=1123282 RepID=A0A1M5YXK5_9FIRM|nr:(2Fe-2S)-binding protein [Sporobacter termitidis]SHI16789.1 xanthine dehydrogenase YagT iron-sulfur-binding subunit [Sporobacter termitidis DSM 10068]
MKEEKTRNASGSSPGSGVQFTHETTMAQAAAAIKSIPTALQEFRCPTCGRIFLTLADLKAHCAEEHPESVIPEIVLLRINGKDCEVLIEPHWTLQRALQFRLGLTGAKHMCNRGVCGSCTVIMAGRAVLACTTLAIECEGQPITTVEGIAADPKWKPLVDAYCRWDAMQCGYCTPGFLISAKALLDKNPHPTEDECREALAGNICICGTYPRHSTAIMEAALKMAKEA